MEPQDQEQPVWGDPINGQVQVLEAIQVKSEQVFHLKNCCSNFGPVLEKAIYPTTHFQKVLILILSISFCNNHNRQKHVN